MTDKDLIYEDTLPGGTHWSMVMRKGTTLRLIDVDGGANVGMLFYNPMNKLERYNAPDTLKCQHTFKLTKGHCLYSDMGHVFCSITDDSVGWHDTVGGNLSTTKMQALWGEKNYQDNRNDWNVSGERAFMVEMAKYELSGRDMAANLNLFSQVKTDAEGNMQYIAENSQAGDHIDLRFEMDTLVILHTCPHPMSTAADYPKKPVTYQIRQSAPVTADDLCMNHCDENQRGFENNRIYHQCGH
jgi:hypothetical protein